MAAPIGPGDWVECRPKFYLASPGKHVRLIGSWPVPGGVYRVREVGMMNGEEPAIRLVGIVASIPGHPDCWWPAKHFRPIYPGDGLIKKLMEPVDLSVHATEDA